MTNVLHFEVRDTRTRKGRGVFALRAFSAGETVEVCPAVPLTTPYERLPEELKRIVFKWEWRDGRPAQVAIALGYGTLYNHNNPSNMRYEVDRTAVVVRFVAARDIGEGEELTINYSDASGQTDNDWWFEEKKIIPILS